MQLASLLHQLPRLMAVALDPAVTAPDMCALESMVRSILDEMATYRLLSATPVQTLQYFSLLEAYARDLNSQSILARQALAQQALSLCGTLTHQPLM